MGHLSVLSPAFDNINLYQLVSILVTGLKSYAIERTAVKGTLYSFFVLAD